MEINEVKQQILSGQLDKWYIFTGEENAVARIYIDKLAESSGSSVKFADSIIDVVSKPKSQGFIQLNSLYVIIDDTEFLSNEKAWDAIDGALKSDLVVFWYTEVDKRKKFWKRFADKVVTFEKLDSRILKRHIQGLDDKHKDKLIDVCEGYYGRIQIELNKCYHYMNEAELHGYDMYLEEALDDLIDDGTIQTPAYDAIFDFVSAVLDRDVELAYNLLEQAYAVGEANMVLLSVLYNNFRALLQVQSGKNSESGLTGWQIKNVVHYIDRYSTGELIHALRVLRQCEFGIKRGRIRDEITVHYFLANVI